ncbi:MAG: glycine--tRNA ligase subunit beta [Candidatus Korobacteraceae bacterium]|jgi:glycyl-tRNA synthetase beta chain
MDFLLEIGTEEIPARMIDGAREELARRVGDLLQRERLADSVAVQSYSTPRRLAVLVSGVAPAQPDLSEKLTGPSIKVAYKDGAPTPAAEAFARKANVSVDALEKITTPKGEYLAATVLKKGRPAAEIFAESLPKEIAGIYWAKSMYWRGKSAERFVRPVRWVVTLLDGEVVPLEFAGIRAGDTTQGHRILSSGPLTIGRPADYVTKLAAGSVVVSSAEREHRIRKALDAATRTIPNARWREDKSLLDTVVNLTEFPSVVLGSFDAEFLALADEVLVTVMRDHQKYFALEDADGRLLPHFLAVLNTDGDPGGLIRHGNERVLRARFNDARFFWETDQKIPLRGRVEMLKSVTFQKDLGSYYDKTLRVQKLGSLIAETIRSAGGSARPGIIFKAAHLCKADLTTELVKEFTELQGIIGGLYAKVQELDPILPRTTVEAIGDAIYDQYKPESMDDSVPRSVEGGVVAIADKADSIAGMFALGLQPTGSKDPFALRRAANGIVKIIAEHKLPLPISKLLSDALEMYFAGGPECTAKFIFRSGPDYVRGWVDGFFRERLEFYLRNARGFRYDIVNAVLSKEDLTPALTNAENPDYGPDLGLIAAGSEGEPDRRLDPADWPPLAVELADAITSRSDTPQLKSAATSFKRTRNILQQALDKHFAIGPFNSMLASAEEAHAVRIMDEAAAGFWALLERGEYGAAIDRMAALADPFEQYFDKVMVMHENELVRRNRLGFLALFYKQFRKIADFSEIVTEGK